MFDIAKLGRKPALLTMAACAVAMIIDPRLFVLAFFAVGVAGTRFKICFPSRIPAWALWLGDISFSLYLTHWIVIATCFRAWGSPGILVGAVATLPVAWIAWRYVERPSIYLRRRIGDLPILRVRQLSAA